MQAAAATAPPPPPLPARRRVYTALDPRCEWTSTDEADTLAVDVSGFRKEELRVLYNTRRKLKVTGERQVGGAQWARFLKVFPVPRSCDASAIQAKMNIESARLVVILPKGSVAAAAAKDKHKEHRPGRSQTLGELMRPGNTDGSSGSSSGSMWSAQEDPGKGKVEEKERRQDQAMEEPRQDQAMTAQDLPRSDGDANENAGKNNDDDGKGESKRWWKKIRVLHVLGFVLVLALVGVGATILYIVLL
ncbi:inactive protein RESTRICTED TEV MOVEMENT 2-like [Panicum miliaceum]|uniref:Inactive protein RESTRICTED TEV MOVEMENT 2-like n=1 Tax=Panicum miliaceum TaxID=4540 RepID=A0A3L6SCE1_PANMI|nr:inactive protein RESTRICTED TEV MOVEMENT 2-like [Panicum miliaceum]